MGFIATIILAQCLITLNMNCGEGRSISSEEDLELEQQLNHLNKPYIKSIQTKYGKIYDCVEINRQHAFDHPKLKNHSIQMRPTTFLQGVTPQEDSSSILESSKIEELPRGGCPSETVPIRRITKEDLIRTKLSSNIHPFTQETPSSHYAITATKGYNEYYGAEAHIVVYNPVVSSYDQSSETMISISSGSAYGLNSINIGWTVNPKLYGDNKTRLFTRWTSDNYQTTGCYNTLCPGFVQISNYFSVDSILDTVSIYNGIQRQLKFSVFQDQFTGNWMFFIGHQNHFMGYWPRSIFQNLGYYANSIEWGGATHSLVGEENMPQMGSGHFLEEGYRKACFFHRVHLIPTIGDDFINPSETDLAMISNKPNCYRVLGKDLIWSSEYAFYFGGPGGTCGS